MNTDNKTTIEMPASTPWPMVLALGIMLAASGLVTNLVFSVAGAILCVASLAGWIHQLLPGEGEQEVALAPPDQRARPVEPTRRKVQSLAPGVPGHRAAVPERVPTYSAGMRGGILGGIAMAAVATLYSVLAGRGIWYPVNLLAGILLPQTTTMSAEQLQQFHIGWLALGILVHGASSIGVGLLFAALLPALPRWPIVWGGLVAPLLWTGGVYASMGVLNPLMNNLVNWPWFVVSQLAFGLTAGYVVVRSEMIPTQAEE